MKRFVYMTIGITHSGKTSFAKEIERVIPNTLLIDQDNHAAFLNTHYPKLVPTGNENTLKVLLSQFILSYAIEQTNHNIIISSSNLNAHARKQLLHAFFPEETWHRVFIYFHLDPAIIQERIAQTTRTTAIFRNNTLTFQDIYTQHALQLQIPSADECDTLFIVHTETDLQRIQSALLALHDQSITLK